MRIKRTLGIALNAIGFASSGAFAAPPPSLTSGQVLTATINVANPKSLPIIKVAVSAPAGIATCSFLLTSPAGASYVLNGCAEPPGILSGSFEASAGPLFSGVLPTDPSGAAEIANQPSVYLQSGTYTLTAAQLTDWAGNSTSYDASQLAAIFGKPTIAVVNKGTPDYTPPTAVSAQIDTPIVDVSKPNATVKVTVKVTDNYSGVRVVGVSAMLPGVAGAEFSLSGIPAVPTTAGNIVAFDVLPSTTATGTYYITELYLVDAAGNYFIPTNASAIFGGKITFQVKK